MRQFFSAVFSLALVGSLFGADNGLWIEGKDQPSRRVNRETTALSTKSYVNVADALRNSVVNISSSTKPKKEAKPEKNTPKKNQNQDLEQFKQFFGDDFFEKFFGGQGGGGGFPNSDQNQQSLGSGFIISSDGYVVTNNHVVDKGNDIRVIMSDETEYAAKVVGKDPKTDLALLKIEPKKKLEPVILGDSTQMKVGDIVVAIGNPFGLSHTTTQGIISAKERSIGFGAYDDFIQTDASINPGNSGGPLLNINGEVIGINSAIVASAQGIGFAIPINLAKDILIKLKTDGKVTRSWLGVMIQKVTEELASSLKLPKRQGALVSEVVENAPAKKAGILPGDVITKFDGKVIQDWHQLPLLVATLPQGKSSEVELVRDGKVKTVKVVVEKLQDKEADQASEIESQSSDVLGLQVDEISPEIAKIVGVPVGKGVFVSEIDADSPAKDKGLLKRDVIIELNKKSVASIAEYKKAIDGLKAGDDVLMLVKRKSLTTFIAFRLPK